MNQDSEPKPQQESEEDRLIEGPKNIIGNLAGTVAAIKRMEGEYWVKEQERVRKRIQELGDNPDPNEYEYVANSSLPGCLRQIEKIKNDDIENADENPIVYTIYGTLGDHRYYVHLNGEVHYSRRHSLPEHVKKAEALGFKIDS